MISFLLTSSLAISSADHFLSTTILKIRFFYFLSFSEKNVCGSSNLCVCWIVRKNQARNIYFFFRARAKGTLVRNFFVALWNGEIRGITFISGESFESEFLKRKKLLVKVSFYFFCKFFSLFLRMWTAMWAIFVRDQLLPVRSRIIKSSKFWKIVLKFMQKLALNKLL